jgi:outer membrane protein TolC
MKNKFQSLLFIGVLSASLNLFGEEDPTSELSDGPQTLPSPSNLAPKSTKESTLLDNMAPPSSETVKEEAPKEEVKAEVSEETKEEVAKEEVAKEEVAKEETKEETTTETTISDKENQKSAATNKPDVLSEDDLLQSNSSKKKKESKVKTAKINESEIYIQEADKYKLTEIFKNLQLNDVIEQGLRKNYDQNIRAEKDSLNEITFQGAKSAFWMPEFKVNLTTANQRISTLRTSSRAPLAPNPTTPTGTLGLSLGDYTVFNWGKDYALYLNTKSSYQRNKEIFDESKRELKLELIGHYFALMSAKNNEQVRLEQLRQASFVYRLSKEKITIGKTSKQDYYQARSEYLKAQNDYHESKITSEEANENLVYLLADDIGTKYVLNENLDYRRIKISLEESINFAAKNNPTLLTNKTSIENAERSYDVALKEVMPLPKFTINLGAYNKKFASSGNQTVYETYSGSGNVELVASLNASWSLTGADGFFNSNKLAIGRIEKELALKVYEKNNHLTSSLMRQTYQKILSLQNQLIILEARIPSLQKSYDTVLENYLSGKTKYNDFHLALIELTETKILKVNYLLLHLKEKLNLAKLAGLEDFPGENFEHLAVRVKGK